MNQITVTFVKFGTVLNIYDLAKAPELFQRRNNVYKTLEDTVTNFYC